MTMQKALRWLLSLIIVAGLGIAGYAYLTAGGGGTHLTAYFARSTGLYSGDDVRVLGVTVGQVDSVQPEPRYVKITFTVNSGVPVPADAKAAIVAPNLVTSRFIQLVPAYSQGPTLRSGSVIPLRRTAVPVEWDDIKTQLTRLATALGPTGADKGGALAGTLKTADANLTGSAEQLHTMLHTLSEATQTVSDNRGNLFGTISSLETFVNALVRNDASVRSFASQLAAVSGLLNDNRSNLALALSELDDAVGQVKTFVEHNRSGLKSSIASLAELSQTLLANQYRLALLLHVSPTALSNFYNIIDPRYHAATGTLAAANFDNVAQLVCRQIVATGGVVRDCLTILQPLVDQMGMVKLPPKVKADVIRAATSEKAHPTLTTTPPGTAPLDNLPTNASARKLLSLLLPGGSS